MKYIMFEDQHGTKVPIIFPDSMVHKTICEHIQHMAIRESRLLKPISAGFVDVNADCYGKSETLNLSADDNDKFYISFNNSLAHMDVSKLPEHVLNELKKKLGD